MDLNLFPKDSRHFAKKKKIINKYKKNTQLPNSVNLVHSCERLSFPAYSWLSWRTTQTLLMLRKRESREKLKEKERMMDIWSLMMPNSLSQVLFLSLFIYIFFFYSYFSKNLHSQSWWPKNWREIFFRYLKSQHPGLNVGSPSRLVATVMVLCRDNGCSFLFLLPVSCLCFLCPILWAGS